MIRLILIIGPGIDDPIAMVRDINENGTFEDDEVFFFAKDHLGSVHALTNKQGTPVQRYSYSAYGKTKVVKLNTSAKMIKNPYGYTSREWEEETGDYYYRARYYNPGTGRFLSPDPIDIDGGDMNFYRYVSNNPINFNDPNGTLTPAQLGYVAIRTGAASLFAELVGLCFAFPDACKDLTGIDMRPRSPVPKPNGPTGPTCNPAVQSCAPQPPRFNPNSCNN